MRIAYSFLLYLCLPFLFLRLFLRALRNPAYLHHWRQRLAYKLSSLPQNAILVHAVSLGETNAALPLLQALRQAHPDKPIIISNMTPSGAEKAQSLPIEQCYQVYLPYDLPGAIKRFLLKLKPCLLITMETELWPNLFYHCHRRKIPIIVANARLSYRSAKGYSKISGLSKQLLSYVSAVAAQSKADAKRLIKLGLKADSITITGSIKFDFKLPASLQEEGHALRQQWPGARPILIAASTHEKEEKIVLQAVKSIRKQIPNLLLILVPRHKERFNKVKLLCEKAKLSVVNRSSGQLCTCNDDVFLADTLGELPLFYAAADVAFVGGSLIMHGGHNLLEPASLGIPVITGPYMFNFVEINRLLQNEGAAFQVETAKQLAYQAQSLLLDGEWRDQVGSKGKMVVAKNQGAVARHIQLISKFIN